jgi:poly-beta-1,6-N-acetyl-D-glucosamine synthase
MLFIPGVFHFCYILYALFPKKIKNANQLSNNKLKIHHIVCFHNESEFIKNKLRNCYKLNYPDIIHSFINDNSTDDTLELLNKYKKKGTFVFNNTINIGKNQSQIMAVKKSNSDLILFTDANVFLEKDSLKHLVQYFSNNEVGGVCGNVMIKTQTDKVEFSGRYWNLEKKIKQLQTRSGAVIGFDGGFYCVKRQYNPGTAIGGHMS